MSGIKSGDLVVLKSGGPTMTVDTVNTDIFDDSKITGVLCVWFVGDKLERVRFDHRAIEPASLQQTSPAGKQAGLEGEAVGDYKVVLDNMVEGVFACDKSGSITHTNAAVSGAALILACAGWPAGKASADGARRTTRSK